MAACLSRGSVCRREYWYLFNDFGTKADGLLLTLPMENFALFDLGTGRAFALEVGVSWRVCVRHAGVHCAL